jgi:hypothetical protein
VLAEELGEGDDVRHFVAEERGIAGDAVVFRARAGEEGDPARVADGILDVGAVEADGAGGEPIEVGRSCHGVPVAAHGRTEIVGHDEEDIEGGSGGGGCGEREDEEEGFHGAARSLCGSRRFVGVGWRRVIGGLHELSEFGVESGCEVGVSGEVSDFVGIGGEVEDLGPFRVVRVTDELVGGGAEGVAGGDIAEFLVVLGEEGRAP